MGDLVVIGFALIGFGIGLKLIGRYLKATDGQVKQPDCFGGHSWEEVETFRGSDIVFLRCKVCKKTLKQIMDG